MSHRIRAGATRHRMSTIDVGLVVLASTVMVVLGVGLLTAADSSSERQHGAPLPAYDVRTRGQATPEWSAE